VRATDGNERLAEERAREAAGKDEKRHYLFHSGGKNPWSLFHWKGERESDIGIVVRARNGLNSLVEPQGRKGKRSREEEAAEKGALGAQGGVRRKETSF